MKRPTAFKFLHPRMAAFALAILAIQANAAVVPDRTRIIYSGKAKAESLTISNKSLEFPYVVQSWIENLDGEKVTSPFVVLPPLQRIEVNESNVLRIVMLSDQGLPADRESAFYLNVREVPPATEAVNSFQIALHSKIKLFYRPEGVPLRPEVSPADSLRLRHDAVRGVIEIDNPSAYHITIVEGAIDDRPLKFESVMVAPKASAEIPFKEELPKKLSLSYINDFGGQDQVQFLCDAAVCRTAQ